MDGNVSAVSIVYLIFHPLNLKCTHKVSWEHIAMLNPGVLLINDTRFLYLGVVSVEQMQMSCKCMNVVVTKHLFWVLCTFFFCHHKIQFPTQYISLQYFSYSLGFLFSFIVGERHRIRYRTLIKKEKRYVHYCFQWWLCHNYEPKYAVFWLKL